MSSAVISALTPGQILYLQPKREKAEAGNEFYNAVEGDTMYHDISAIRDKTEKSL